MKSSDQILATAHLLNLKVIFPHGPVAVCSVCAFQTKVFVHRPGSRTKQYTIPTNYQCFFMSTERRGLYMIGSSNINNLSAESWTLPLI